MQSHKITKFFVSCLQNAFPVSGQLYTTHLLSLEALLTVIDSTEAHCQAKVLNSAAQQDQSEATTETDGSVNRLTDSTTGSQTPRNNIKGIVHPNMTIISHHLLLMTFQIYIMTSFVQLKTNVQSNIKMVSSFLMGLKSMMLQKALSNTF